MMTMERIEFRGQSWFVVDARYDEAPGDAGSHWHLTLTNPAAGLLPSDTPPSTEAPDLTFTDGLLDDLALVMEQFTHDRDGCWGSGFETRRGPLHEALDRLGEAAEMRKVLALRRAVVE